MKKIIKIFALILFVILFFGITTSEAAYESSRLDDYWDGPRYTVGQYTTAQQMIDAAEGGYNLTGISSTVRDQNPFLLCREKHWALYGAGRYELDGEKITYPDDEINGNGYAKAYILAAPNFIKSDTSYGDPNKKDERQYAWYFIHGQIDYGETANDLYQIALAYQDYKKNEEKDITATVDPDTQAEIIEDKIVYGPIKIEYSYKHIKPAEDSKEDEWGGFNYAFFDRKGNNVTDKVNFYTLSDGVYTPITATQIKSEDVTNGYYKVRTAEYNNVDLYVVTTDKTIGTVTIKIQENKVDYMAEVYPIKGDYYKAESGTVWCAQCRDKMENATTGWKTAIDQDRLYKYNDKYYKYVETVIETKYLRSGSVGNIVRVGDNEINAIATTIDGTRYPKSTRAYVRYSDNYWVTISSEDAAVSLLSSAHYPHNCSVHSMKFQCTTCHYGACAGNNSTSNHTSGYCTFSSIESYKEHFRINHMGSGYKYERVVYNFTEFAGCGRDMGDKCSDCGTPLPGELYYHSQGLHIIYAVKTNQSNELKLDFEVELAASIEITKKWDDFSDYYGYRPENLEFKVYRSLDGTNWTKLVKGTDYEETEWVKNETNWVMSIVNLRRTDDDGKLYHFKVEEVSNPHYYEVKYPEGNILNNNEEDMKMTITNTLKYIDLEVEKVWNDDNNHYGTRPNNIGIQIYRCVAEDYSNWDNLGWEDVNWEGPLVEGTDYTLTWSNKNTNNWKAEINNLLLTDENRNLYYFKVVEVPMEEETETGSMNYYNVTYASVTADGTSVDNYIRTSAPTKKITITNELRLVDINVTKIWEDYNDLYDLRPENITLKVYRCVAEDYENWDDLGWEEINWEGPLTEGKDYDPITWTKNENNTWTATISDLLEVNRNGYKYYFKVVEEAQNYYNITYLSATKSSSVPQSADNYIRADVQNKAITITNTIKHVDIDITKEWLDYSDEYELRPDEIDFNVFRSIDEQNWTKLTKGVDYKLTWKKVEGNTWEATISQLLGVDENGNDYYFKVEEQAIVYYDPTYVPGQIYLHDEEEEYVRDLTIENNLKHINISGYVWLDGQTGIKPAIPNNGIMDDSETKMANIVVHLYYKLPETQGGNIVEVAKTVTDENGYYEFLDREIGYYYVEFDYDGIHYEDTIKLENPETEKVSKAFENDVDRDNFNSRFTTITYKQSNDGTALSYNYLNRESVLITNKADSTEIAEEFLMKAATPSDFAQNNDLLMKTDTENLNLGLITRGTDIALSTDVFDAEVTINGQQTNYLFNKEDNSIIIGNKQTSEEVSYNLNLYASDYHYRIRDYITKDEFQENDYINNEDPSGLTTGNDLQVKVKYELNLQNQSTEPTKINEVKYTYDSKFAFIEISDNNYSVQNEGNVLTINFNGLELKDGETKTVYLLFLVNENDNAVELGEFSNKVEITSYSTEKGLIDVDSQPGNFINDNEVEDDNDTAGGFVISENASLNRKITGKVFNEGGQNVDDVIVQLIELKQYNGKTYEYIWQETVSGTGKGQRLNGEGTQLEVYTYTQSNGQYEFVGFIPGDYIVRFIYGDGTTYDLTENVIKYNGQDYKSMTDVNYNKEWYNTSSYNAGESVARDNEARRLESMSYSVEIDATKGVLLKLLNNVTPEGLNETEKEIIISTYNNLYDPDITEVTSDVINKLLKEQVLRNTWMCAETSKIKIAVDTQDASNISSDTQVDGTIESYDGIIEDVNLGLEERPETKIELKKYITGFKLTASNGQTLVNAYVDVSEYLDNPANISNKVQGIKDNVTILSTVWQYEVAPTNINTIIDGSNLEFEYTLVVKNTGETDYLSTELADAYKNSEIDAYAQYLTTKASEIKGLVRNGTYRAQIGNIIGKNYYIGGTGQQKVLTEITNIRDYVNNDLIFVTSGGDVAVDQNAPNTHRILRDNWSMQEATINTILKTTKTTGKMENDGAIVLYSVVLGKNPISSTGNLNFENYIAEVMSFTNAAGRRTMTSTPGNAEIIDHEHRDGKAHEIDEADTGRIQIGAATGEDETTNFIIIVAVAIGIAVVAIGTYIIKKYFLK